MALNVLQCPTYVAHTGNPVPFHVEAGADWQSPIAGAVWGYQIEFATDDVIAGEKFFITLNGQTFEIEVYASGATIGDSGLQVLENDPVQPIDDYLNDVFIPTVLQNWHIFNAVSFSVAGNFLFINTPFEYVLEVDCDVAGSVVTQVGTGTPETYPENYRIIADFYVSFDGGSTYEKIAQKIAFPEKTTPFAAKYELSGLLDAYVSPMKPVFNDTSNQNVESAVGLCKVLFSEGYGSPVQYQSTNGTTPNFGQNLFYFLSGKSPFMIFPDRYQNSWITNDLLNLFLTNQPKTKRVSETQQEYLYYFFPGVLSQAMKLNVKVFFTDNTTTSIQLFPVTMTSCSEVYFPVGYTQLDLGNVDPLKTVSKYTVNLILTPSGTVYSEVRTYILDTKCHPYEKNVLFLNELNGYDTVRFLRGGEEYGVAVEKEEAARILEYDYTPEAGTGYTFSVKSNPTGRMNTGRISLEYAKYLRELFESKEVYLIDNELIKFVPIRISPGGISLYKEDELFYNITIEYDYRT